MAPTYKVRYFDATARAEPIRLLLSYGKLPFEDERISKEDWPQVKPTTPLGQLPVLEVDGKAIPQSSAIYRYLGSVVNLAGNDAKENLYIDVAYETILDLKKLVMEFMYEQDATKKQEKEKKFKDSLPFYLGKLEEHAKKQGGYLALNKLSWVDVVFVTVYESMTNLGGPDTFNVYPNLQQVKKNVLSQQGIKDWIKKRPAQPQLKYDLKHDV